MKPALFLSAAWTFVLLASISRPLPAKVDLVDAIAKKLVTVTATSTGGNSEHCARLQIRNTSGTNLSIAVTPGTVLNTDNEGSQDILITQPLDILVSNGQSVTKEAYGFCCQASNGVPAEGETFRVEACGNPKLASLAQHLATKPYDPLLQQYAIWAVSDRHSVGGIYSDDRKQCEELRTVTANLLGEPVPFYDVDYGYTPNTDFVYAPSTLKGEMQYRVVKPGKASLHIYAPDGSLFETFYTDRPMSSGFYKQRFSYTATDMAPGEYTVKFTVDGTLVCENLIVL